MRHLKKGKIFGRTAKQRKLLMTNLAKFLILKGKVKTTHAKAREVRRFVERLITIAKTKEGREAKRSLSRFVTNKNVVKRLLTKLKDRYKDRKGGYTRIIKIGPRRGDRAFVSELRLV